MPQYGNSSHVPPGGSSRTGTTKGLQVAADQPTRPGVIFLHIGWANEYQGAPDDLPQGKFGYIQDGNVDMGESMNFKNHKGRCFGYAPHHVVNLRRLGAAKGVEDFVDGVLVVWTAGNPDGSGRYIVGWYKKARVYSVSQEDQEKSRYGFIAEAAVNDCCLLRVDERTFFIPSMVQGWPGLSNAFYASDNLAPKHLDMLLAYVEGRASPGFYDGPIPTFARNGGGWLNQDPAERAKVEKAAVATVRVHYEAKGWSVESVEADALGWDLNATFGSRRLCVEVKGRCDEGPVELTVNEYRAMTNDELRMDYRLAIVFDALSQSPKLTIFRFMPGGGKWVSDTGDVLELRLMTGAIASF